MNQPSKLLERLLRVLLVCTVVLLALALVSLLADLVTYYRL